MNTSQLTIQAHITDTNHRQRGVMPIKVDFDQVGPLMVEHDGKTYSYTHKAGTNHKTGLAVREMATCDDARLWITQDGAQVWED
jgi:hypothetical protein